MRKLVAFFALLLVAAGAGAVQADAGVDKVALYTSSAYVSKSAEVSTPLGDQAVTFSIPQSADDDTLMIIDDGAGIIEYSVGVKEEDRDSLLLRIVKENPDKQVTIITEYFSIKAEIDSILRDKYVLVRRPELIDEMSGVIINQRHKLFIPISLIQTISFEKLPDFNGLEDVLEKTVTVREYVSVKDRALTASYFVSNASWKPNYQLFLKDEETGRLYYWAKATNNTKEDWTDIDLTVVAGQPNIKYSAARYYDYSYNEMAAGSAAAPMADMGIGEEQFAVSESQEYHVYGLGRKISIPKESSSYVPLLAEDIGYEKVYEWDARGRVYGEKKEGTVKYSIKFENDTGEPLAAGWVSVYGNGLYAGGNNIEWVSDGDEAELYLAPALDIKAEKFEEITTDKQPESTVTKYSYTLHIENHKSGDVVVKVKESLPSDAQTFMRSLGPSRLENNEIEWNVKIKAGGEQDIVYSYATIYYPRY